MGTDFHSKFFCLLVEYLTFSLCVLKEKNVTQIVWLSAGVHTLNQKTKKCDCDLVAFFLVHFIGSPAKNDWFRFFLGCCNVRDCQCCLSTFCTFHKASILWINGPAVAALENLSEHINQFFHVGSILHILLADIQCSNTRNRPLEHEVSSTCSAVCRKKAWAMVSPVAPAYSWAKLTSFAQGWIAKEIFV